MVLFRDCKFFSSVLLDQCYSSVTAKFYLADQRYSLATDQFYLASKGKYILEVSVWTNPKEGRDSILALLFKFFFFSSH